MNETARRPVLAVVVNNDVTGDSRVLKTALGAARLGWEVVLIGRAAKRRSETRLGPVRLIRVPLARVLHTRFEAERRAAAQPVAIETPATRTLDWISRRAARLPKGRTRATRLLDGTRRRLTGAPAVVDVSLLPDVPLDEVQWRRDWPILTDWWLAFGPELVELQPDVIHANDVQMLMVAARAAGELRLAGHDVSWLYDSHELVQEIDWGGPVVSAAVRQLESEYIGQADAVITVSAEIAERLRTSHSLDTTPAVVLNAPVGQAPATDASVRDTVGVAAETPLLVYSGYVAEPRGLDVAVEALPHLPEVHLAIVANSTNAVLQRLLDRASELGVADRIHVAPYVAPFAVPAYLSSATIGLAPFHSDPNHHDSLPTKLAEYVHARLPVVVSDMRTMAAFVRSTGIGDVFEAGSALDFARAVTSSLENHDERRAAITDDVLEQFSWERQMQTLDGVYRHISGLAPEAEADPVGWDATEEPVSSS